MKNLDTESITGIAALLVHAAKIDEIYSEHERSLVKDFIKSYLGDDNIDEILKKAEEIEKNSNQLLNFTNIIKQNSMDVKKDILEKLFIKIIENTNDRKFKINAEMMNLLGCSKENFYKLMNYMNYKKDKTVDTYIFKGERKKKEKLIRFDKKENPFNKLLSLNIK